MAESITSDALWQQHPDAQTWAGYLQLATDAWDGIGGFAALHDTDTDNNRQSGLPEGFRSYLVKHPQEDPAKYAWRARNAVYPPLPRLVGETLTSFLFSRGPTRDGTAGDLDEWAKDADGAGGDLGSVLRRLAIHAQLFPFGLAMIGAPDGDYESQADALAAGWSPYVNVIHPGMLFDWRREDGRFTAAKLVDTVAEGAIDQVRKVWTRCRVMTEESGGTVKITTYRQDEKGKPGKFVSEKILRVPEVPLVVVSFSDTVVPEALSGAAPLGLIVEDARGLYNDLSLLYEHIAAQCFATLVYQEAASKQVAPLVIGSNNALKYPPTMNAPTYIAPPDSVAATLFRCIEERIRRIYRMARLEFVLNDAQNAPSSGVARQYEFQTTNRALASMAGRMAEAEKQIAGHVAAFAKRDPVEFRAAYVVSWPDDFDCQDLEAEIRRTQEAMLLPFDSITKAALLRQLRDDLVTLTGQDMIDSNDELDAKAEAKQEREDNPPPPPPIMTPPVRPGVPEQTTGEEQAVPVE
jgi:hypothetical protein